jgi:predicted RNase H-like HicB family nuclease
MTDQPTRYIVTDGQMTLTLEVAEEGGYLVTSPYDPEIMTQADTVEEAFEMARDVVALYKEVREKGLLPPKNVKKAPTTKGKRTTSTNGRKKAS